MNAITEVPAVSAETLEHVLGTGDLGKLTVPQRVEYYAKMCQSLGLNPLTRPIRFLSLNGQVQAYFTRDGTDQLRQLRGITLHVVDKTVEAGVYAVTVRARDKHGREDEDVGAVALPAGGESRANALMKAITKAKRRVTLSICGLGQTDESELDTMPGARTFDADEEPPVVPIRTVEQSALNPYPAQVGQSASTGSLQQPGLRAVAAAMPRAPRVTETQAAAFEGPARTDEQWQVWLDKLRAACAVLYRRSEVVEVGERATVGDALATGPQWVQREISAILAENYKRFPDEPEAQDEVHIEGEEKLAAG